MNYRSILVSALCLCLSIGLHATNDKSKGRKKVAVVLSGGGAKGAAHVRALKVIEEAGIPVDYVVGTSIGALVGGMYASGYNADQMDSIMTSQNWKTLLTDASTRKSKDILRRQYTDGYMLTLWYEKSPFEIVEGGFLKGNNLARLFTDITADTPDSIDYNTLPIPFACVATDIVTGKEIDMHSGVLAESMRASMAIPGVFAPVKKDSMILVDGGMTNNYPVDVARRMGADYVIGVNLNKGIQPYGKIKTTMDMAIQLLDLTCSNKVEKNIDDTDVFIDVNVEGYSAASFNNVAIDTLLLRGEAAARGKWDELIALRQKLGLTEPVPAPQKRAMPENAGKLMPKPTIYKENNKPNFLGLGARFDNEELASILLGGLYEVNRTSHFRVGLNARLGRRIGAEAFGTVSMGKNWTGQLSYNFQRNDVRIYHDGERMANEVYIGHIARLDFSKHWKNFRMTLGADYSYYTFDDPLVTKEFIYWTEDNSSERGVSYNARLTYDNRDAVANATQGVRWSVGYRLFTDNGVKFYEADAMHILDANFSIAIPLTSHSILTPSVAGRWLPSYNDYFTLANIIGGVNTWGHYLPQQIPFAGINFMQMTRCNLMVAGLNFRQLLTTNNYLFLVANYGHESDKLFANRNARHMYGAALGYGYKTPVGPIEANFNWSNVTKKLGFTINLGYMF